MFTAATMLRLMLTLVSCGAPCYSSVKPTPVRIITNPHLLKYADNSLITLLVQRKFKEMIVLNPIVLSLGNAFLQ